jgi:D-alanyl-D-alanine carboxypeptidase (penicillin-binding protein 5/6)
MSEPDDYIIKTFLPEVARAEKRFPVVAQLAVLGLILVAIFGVTYAPKFMTAVKPASTEKAPDVAPLVIAENTIQTIPALGDIHIGAKSAYIYDVRAKRALFSKDPDTVLPLASITKLMTALIAHELVASNKTVVVPKAAISQSGSSGMSEGERFTTAALSKYAVLASSNDAAYALASAVGAVIDDKKDPNQTFVKTMNIRATELGLPHLHFLNPTGLDISTTEPGAVGTAREISFLMEYIIANYPEILAPTTVANARVYNADGVYHDAENTNPIIGDIPNLLGSKTGYTDLAGGNLTIAFDVGYNRPIIITVLGSTYDGRFTDVKKLVEAVTAAFTAKK